MKERITDIEIKLMHHENTIQQLNDVVTRQQCEIDKLQAGFRQLKEQFLKILPSDVRDVRDEEPPPHY
ncbi:MAG: SlyX family protein [Geobacteraceae bacterium]|nr:SlyX family protein [Geobacteraceae bacterium]